MQAPQAPRSQTSLGPVRPRRSRKRGEKRVKRDARLDCERSLFAVDVERDRHSAKPEQFTELGAGRAVYCRTGRIGIASGRRVGRDADQAGDRGGSASALRKARRLRRPVLFLSSGGSFFLAEESSFLVIRIGGHVMIQLIAVCELIGRDEILIANRRRDASP